jgi:hypothetical protein
MTRRSSFWFLAAAGAIALVAASACSSNDETVNACEAEPVEKLKELLVVDEAVLDDARSKNRNAGPWSFAHAMENMARPGTDPGEFVRSWLVNWVSTKQVNGFILDRATEERDATMNTIIICPWLKRTPSNACNDDCSTCGATKLDLGAAPFRLIAIANRIDLKDEVAGELSGEGRLVFGLTDGAADDPSSRVLAMSVIVEYALPETRTAKEWATAWHELGRFPAFDEDYRRALEGVTNSFTKRDARPGSVNGSALAQVRTNESALNWIWQLREFGLDSTGALTLRPVRNTPGEALNGSEALGRFVATNKEAILAKRFEMPDRLRAGSADQLVGQWVVPGTDPVLRKAFAEQTCNGCHATEQPNVDSAFHVSPYRKGAEKLSPFVYSPTGGPDDLSRRATVTTRVRCGG